MDNLWTVPASRPVDPAQRAKVLYVRVSEQTHRAVRDHADLLGIGVGDLARTLIEREVLRWPSPR